MSYVYAQAATRILEWFHQAERDLVGRAIVRANGRTGIVKAVKLDEHHGLCFTLENPLPSYSHGEEPQFYPVSTIRSKL